MSHILTAYSPGRRTLAHVTLPVVRISFKAPSGDYLTSRDLVDIRQLGMNYGLGSFDQVRWLVVDQ